MISITLRSSEGTILDEGVVLGFPRIRGAILRVPAIRIILLGGHYYVGFRVEVLPESLPLLSCLRT